MSFPDHFSVQAQDYARYRPRYPEALFECLAQVTDQHQSAWDCATGNGQAALGLVPYFEQIYATDASAQQIAHAFAHERIRYAVVPAERSQLPAQSIDLITVGQALHWFDHPAFFEEVRRVLRPGGAIAVWFYGYFRLAPQETALNDALQHFYGQIDPYWPPEAQLIHQGYGSIAFPFQELAAPELAMNLDWTLTEMVGYLMTWSGTQRRRLAVGEEAIAADLEQLRSAWPDPEQPKRIEWPLPLRVFRPE